MTIVESYSLYLLMICNGVLAGAAAVAILRFQNMLKNQKSFWSSPTGVAMSSQPEGDEFLQAVEKRFTKFEEGLGNLSRDNKVKSASPRSIPHENAVRMAKHGATVDDLTRTCGLSDIEARLVMRVHGNSGTAARLN
ncbi:MAG: DUF2802 domain-containing protein [Woeseiaceae bacterium]